jgi:hypothetical protein
VYSESSVPPPSHLTSCTLTKSNLHFDSSFGIVTSELALYKLLTFQVPPQQAVFIISPLANSLQNTSLQRSTQIFLPPKQLSFEMLPCFTILYYKGLCPFKFHHVLPCWKGQKHSMQHSILICKVWSEHYNVLALHIRTYERCVISDMFIKNLTDWHDYMYTKLGYLSNNTHFKR